MSNRKQIVSTLARLIAVLVLFGTAACAPGKATPAAVTPSPLPATVTPSPSPTATETPSPTPTVTETPLPSPTPDGFLNHAAAGFSLTYPASWRVTQRSSSLLMLVDSGGGLVMMMSSQPEKAPQPLDKRIEAAKGELPEGVTVNVTNDTVKVALANGVQAEKTELTIKDDKTAEALDMWIVYTFQKNRGYTILLMSKEGKLASRSMTMGSIFNSIQLFPPRPFDLPRGETLTISDSEPVAERLDPAVATTSAADYVGLLYSGLVRLSPEQRIVPELAESWQISPDGTVYTFTMREGAAFANGDPITADAVRQSWERACDPDTASTTAQTYLGDILGVSDKLAGKADTIKGLKVIDDRTLQVTLDGPKPYFLAKLTYPTAMVIDPDDPDMDSEEWMFAPNSSGPYQVKELIPGEALIFEPNPHYFQPAAIHNIVAMFYGGGPVSLYEEGSVDILWLGADDQLEIAKPENALHGEMLTTPSMCTTMLQLNPALPPTDDPQVRKALLLATDRTAFIDKITSGTALLAGGVLPPAMPGAKSGRTLPAFDPQAAKEALQASKYAGQPLTITLSVSGLADSQRKDAALLADQWQQNLGVRVQVEYVDPAKFNTEVRKKPGNVVDYGWCADYPDPENFLDVLFHSGSPFNVADLKDADLDALLEKARVEPDPAQRLALYQQAEDHLLNQVETIPLLHDVLAVLVKPRVKGFVLSPSHTTTLPLLTLDPAQVDQP